MKKEEFLKQLENVISGLPLSEKDEIMADYEEHFSVGVEAGRSESEIVASLGSPSSIGKQLRADYHIKKAENKVSASSIFRAVIATASLGFFNLIFVVGPFFGLLFLFGGLVAFGIGMVGSSVVGFIASLFAVFSPALIDRFIYLGVSPIVGMLLSVALAGFGILFLIGCWYLAKWFYRGTVAYLKFNISIIQGREERVK